MKKLTKAAILMMSVAAIMTAGCKKENSDEVLLQRDNWGESGQVFLHVGDVQSDKAILVVQVTASDTLMYDNYMFDNYMHDLFGSGISRVKVRYCLASEGDPRYCGITKEFASGRDLCGEFSGEIGGLRPHTEYKAIAIGEGRLGVDKTSSVVSLTTPW